MSLLRILVCSIGLASLSYSAFAQKQFGVSAGPQYVLLSQKFQGEFADLVALTAPEKLNGFGFHAGVWYRSERANLVQFRLGLEWSYRTFDQGYDYDTYDTLAVSFYNYHGTYTTRLHYLEVPVQASYYFWREAHVDLGLTPGYLMYGRFIDEGQVTFHNFDGTTYTPDDYSSNNKTVKDYKRVEMALSVNVGYDFNNGMVASLGYNRTISRLNKMDELFVNQFYNLFRVTYGYDFIHDRRHMRVYHK